MLLLREARAQRGEIVRASDVAHRRAEAALDGRREFVAALRDCLERPNPLFRGAGQLCLGPADTGFEARHQV
ncbi:MAG TPA: hypothetical protein VHN20_07720, partial [Beijerinckiaceae bacterium]|nr:hypothetical protein [Beijerinckiaceae bacterium]